jgi:hypothetical protein
VHNFGFALQPGVERSLANNLDLFVDSRKHGWPSMLTES